MKTDDHPGRCYLKGRDGDVANVILSAVGYTLRLVLARPRMILRFLLPRPILVPHDDRGAQIGFLTDD